jgi:hypothetical protein
MFKEGLLKESFGADFLKGCISIVYTAVKTMGILVFTKKILFNALGTSGLFTEFATHFLSNDRCVLTGAHIA